MVRPCCKWPAVGCSAGHESDSACLPAQRRVGRAPQPLCAGRGEGEAIGRDGPPGACRTAETRWRTFLFALTSRCLTQIEFRGGGVRKP